LREIHAALKPGSLLSVSEALGDPDYRGRAAVRREAEAAGFELMGTEGNPVTFTMNFAKPGPGGASV
jgi:predicted methyltransferase